MNAENEILRRKRYGIREATESELSRMTQEQRWHYNASAFKDVGLHFEFFRHKKRSVRPIILLLNGNIDSAHCGGHTEIKAHLRRFPIQFFVEDEKGKVV